MTRDAAVTLCHQLLNEHGLSDWHVRLTMYERDKFLGKCMENDKAIILNAFHLDIHPDKEIEDTIKHEIAHALVGCAHQHDEIWAAKARELGVNPLPCSFLSLDPSIIDAIRSGADVKVEIEEETVVYRKPKYTVTRLQDKCEICNKVAVEKSSFMVDMIDHERKFILLECGHTRIKNISKGTPFWTLIEDASDVANCAHEWDKNTCTKCYKHKPFDFQIEGMKFGEQAITFHKGVVIMDEMGLGKTIQALGIIKFHPELWPVLYVVKSGIKFQWFKQILTWLGTEHLCQIFESSNDHIIPGLKGYIIGYDMLVPKTRVIRGKTVKQGFDSQRLIDAGIKTMVLDECQQIKNPDSTRTQQVRRLAKEMKVIGLSGTPWKNRGSEFFSILNMIAPTKFSSFAGFKKAWVNYFEDPKTGKVKEGGIKYPDRFKDWIADIAIRRERTEVMKELPLINRMKLYVELDKTEQATYDDSISEFVKWYNQFVIDGTEESLDGMQILAKLARLRHIVGLAKIPQTLEFVKDFMEETDRKIVIFVHHKDVAQIIYDDLKKEYGDAVYQLNSQMNGEERFRIQEEFNKNPKAILIGSTLASGEGLNLQTCADCVMHERQWNPANEEQAEGRFIRIGQTATNVNATYVEANDTVDSILDEMVERKRHTFHETMNKGESPIWNQSEIAREVAESIVAKFNKRNKEKANDRRLMV